MLGTYLSDLTTSLLIYMSLAVGFFGWGKASLKILGVAGRSEGFTTSYIWLGWAICLLAFQFIHLFFPINYIASILVLSVGFCFAVCSPVIVLRQALDGISRIRTPGVWFIVIAVFLVVVWIASRSMLPSNNYDSGLYHFNSVRWINTYSIIPGLGNLHDRLAFNQSFFVYVAALNLPPFFGFGHSIANSFLFLLCLTSILEFLRPALKQPRKLLDAHAFKYLPALFALPALFLLALSSTGLTSPSPDLTSYLLQVMMFVVFSRALSGFLEGERNQDHSAVFLAVLATTAITIKLSNLAFSACMLVAALFLTSRQSRRVLYFPVFLLCFTIFIVWALRGVITSGVPVFPSTFGYFNVDWAMPKETIENTANVIVAWARMPGEHWKDVLGNWGWFESWFSGVMHNFRLVMAVSLSVIFTLLALLALYFKKDSRLGFIEWMVVFPSIAGLVYWFFTAPDPRFSNAIFFMLLVSSISLFVTSIKDEFNKQKIFLFICIAFLVPISVTAAWYKDQFLRISTSGYHSTPKVDLIKRATDSGLPVSMPESGDQGWDSPLPSSPRLNPHLRLRDPGFLSSGFVITDDRH
ncbi:MAG: hypothetical protein ABW116_00810 [Candidatus Sedimenticola sp. 20ELBAFRAG]